MSKQVKKFMSFEFKVDQATEKDNVGTVSGYASTFGNIDQGFDVVDRGAFAKSIKDKRGIFPILLDHDPSKPIGWNIEASEDDYGLKVKGEIQLVTEEACNRYMLAKKAMELNTKFGLSIGYTTIKAEPDRDRPIVRRLKELKLWEYSFVTFPMNEEACLTNVKQMKNLFDRLTEGGYTENQIQEALIKAGLLPAEDKPPSKEVDPETLQSADRLLKILQG